MQYQDTRLSDEEALRAAIEASTVDEPNRGDCGRTGRDPSAFPHKLGPFILEETHFTKDDLKFSRKTKSVPEDWTMSPNRLKGAAREAVLSKIATAFVRGRFSPEHPVTLSNDARILARIPRTATFFCWSYPIDQDLLDGTADISADIAFLAFGGYVYFDKNHEMLSALALLPSEDGGLRFGSPLPWLSEMTKRIGFHRFKPITIPVLRDAGAQHFCWIRPGEIPDAEHGAFAYLFHGRTRSSLYQDYAEDIYFPIVGSGDSDRDEASGSITTEVLSPSPKAGGRKTPPPREAIKTDGRVEKDLQSSRKSMNSSSKLDTLFSPPSRASAKSTAQRTGNRTSARACTPPPEGRASGRASTFASSRPSTATRSRSQGLSTPNMTAPSRATVRHGASSREFPKHPSAPRRGEAVASITPEKEPIPGNELSVVVSLTPPDGCATTKSHICCVIDVSGSMRKEAVITGTGSESEGHGLCLLDVAKHGIRAIIHTLGNDDWFSVVSFNNIAHTILAPTQMNDAGKATAERALDMLQPKGGTDIWAGLYEGLNLLRSKASLEVEGYFSHIMLLTDGESKNKNDIFPNLQREFKQPWRPCSINTFGFGYDLDSPMLVGLAKMGHGAYAFIPDAGFVGTVFVNTLSNLLVTMGKHVSLYLMPGEGSQVMEVYGQTVQNPYLDGMQKRPTLGYSPSAPPYTTVEIGNIQYGQSRDILLRMKIGSSSDPFLRVGGSYCVAVGNSQTRYSLQVTSANLDVGLPEGAAEMVSKTFCRSIFADCLTPLCGEYVKCTQGAIDATACIANAKSRLSDVIQNLETSVVVQDDYMQALLEDANGQVSEAVSRYDWLFKWGRHYLPSVMFAHQLQQCNNFKDASVQHYGGDLFEQVRDQADDAFNSLPPPQPCAPPQAPPVASTGRASASAPPPPPPRVPVSMAVFNDCYCG